MDDEILSPLPLPLLLWDAGNGSSTRPSQSTSTSTSTPTSHCVSGSGSETSSDPPSFSSDDDDDYCVDNYGFPRRKKKYSGPWFNHSQLPKARFDFQDSQPDIHHHRSRRVLEMSFDRSIYLMGNDSDADAEIIETLQTLSLPNLPLRRFQTQLTMSQSTPEALARDEIEKCLDNGKELVDLSSHGLTTLTNATIRPLASFTRVPPVANGHFQRLEPELQIYLYENRLTTLPRELFNINHLKVLSLRQNKLRELPPGIGKLTRLEELNICWNDLRYLPFEFLNLLSKDSRLRVVHFWANPYYRPLLPTTEQSLNDATPVIRKHPAIDTSTFDKIGSRQGFQWKLRRTVRTEVRFLDIGGSLLKGPIFPDINSLLEDPTAGPTRIPIENPGYKPEAPQNRVGGYSSAPSLFEIALRECAKSPQLPSLPSYLPEYTAPAILSGLSKALKDKETGGSRCTICDREFIVPRTEWIEWWEIARVSGSVEPTSSASPLGRIENGCYVLEHKLPLMRLGCSWLCLPEKEVEEEPVVDAV